MAFEATPESVALRNAVLALETSEAENAAEAAAAREIYERVVGIDAETAREIIAARLSELRRLQEIAVLWRDIICAMEKLYKERYYTISQTGPAEMNASELESLKAYKAYAADLGIDAETVKKRIADAHKHHCPVCGNGYF